MSDQTNGGAPNPVPQWIKECLFEKVIKENVKDFRSIRKFEVKPGSAAGDNYATVMFRIDVEVELSDGSTKPLTFMMKTSHDSDLMREMMKLHSMFSVEKGMYDDIVPAFEKLYADAGIQVQFGPSSYELPTHEPYILLENLSTRGFKNANRLEGLDMQHIECVLRKLAQWHAASAVYAATKGEFEDKYMKGFFREETKPMMAMVHNKMTDVFKECVKTYSNYEVYAKDLESSSEESIEVMFRAAKCNPNEFNVLNHGDCWSNNIMFQYDAFGKIKETFLIDYQLPKYGTPAQDLLYFLMSSAKFELKLQKFDYFIKFYHDNLCDNLKLLKYSKKMPKLCDIHTMLYKYGVLGFAAAAGVMGVVLLDPTENANLDNFVSDNSDGDAFKRLMFTNDRYRKHIEAILPWLQNRGAFTF